MSSEFSVYCNFLEEEELPTYEEVSLPPNVTIEEREISSDDEDDDDLEELEQNIKSKQSTTTIASLKCFLPDSKTPIEVQKASITLDQSAPAISIKSDRKPTFKLSSIQTSTLQTRRNAMRIALQTNNTT